MAVVDDAHVGSGLREEHDVVHDERRLAGCGRMRPLEVAERPPVVSVVPTVIGARLERLARAVRHEEGDTARPRVCERRLHARPEIVLGRQVHDRVVHEDGVERPSEAERPHVAEHVLAAGVQLPAQREHLRREVGQRAREVGAQVRRVVAAARAELEQRPGVGDLLEDRGAVALCLGRVVLRCGEEVEPRGEVAVDPHRAKYPRGRSRPAALGCPP